MKKIVLLLCIAFVAAGAGSRLRVSAGGVTLYFFTSGVCPACARAARELPAILKRHPGVALATYETRDSGNRVTEAHRRNIGLLIAMLRQISARAGGRPFLYESRTPFALAIVNGVPYYEKKVSETLTVKKEVPLPVFILGDRAYMGYQPAILEQALSGISPAR